MSKYHLFLFRFTDPARIRKMTDALTQAYNLYPFMNPQEDEASSKGYTLSIRDISDRTDREKILLLTSIVASEQTREYKEDSDCMLLVRIVKAADNDYLSIINVAESEDRAGLTDKIMGCFFERHEFYGIESFHEKESSHLMKTLAYWKELFAKKPDVVPAVTENIVYEQEEFEIEEKLSGTLFNICKEQEISIKSFILAAAGIVVCEQHKLKSTIVGEIRNNNLLRKAPVKVDLYEDHMYTIGEVQKQIKKLAEFGDCSAAQIESASGVRLASTMLVGVDFGDLTGLVDAISKMETNKLYETGGGNDTDMPLLIYYHTEGNVIKLIYSYSNRMVRDHNIADLHDAIVNALIEFAYSFTATRIDDVLSTKTNLSNENRINASKVLFLKSSRLFEDYTNEELIRLAAKCIIHCAMPEETVGEQDELASGVNIVCDGFVEVNRMGPDSVLRPLHLLSDGDVFAIETVCGKKRLNATYISSGNYSRVLTIPTAVMESEILMHPAIYKRLLEIQTERLTNFQDIWLTV